MKASRTKRKSYYPESVKKSITVKRGKSFPWPYMKTENVERAHWRYSGVSNHPKYFSMYKNLALLGVVKVVELDFVSKQNLKNSKKSEKWL